MEFAIPAEVLALGVAGVFGLQVWIVRHIHGIEKKMVRVETKLGIDD